MLNKIEFVKDWRKFKAGETYTFNPGINFLVGDQGTGKSSLIEQVAKPKRIADQGMANVYGDGSLRYMNCEYRSHDNPYRKNGRGIYGATDYAELTSSHGEVIKAMIKTIERLPKNELVIIDEPETALSIRSQIWFLNHLKAQPHQFLIATHSPILMHGAKLVLSLEHKKWMKPQEFIESQYETLAG